MAFDNLNAVSESFYGGDPSSCVWAWLSPCGATLWGLYWGGMALIGSKSDFPLVFLGRELFAVSKVRIWVLPPVPTNCVQALGVCLSPTD